jgi:hypothetical protein
MDASLVKETHTINSTGGMNRSVKPLTTCHVDDLRVTLLEYPETTHVWIGGKRRRKDDILSNI